MKKYILLFILGLMISIPFSQAQMVAPTPPTYETCGQIAVDNGAGGTFMQTDQACLQRNGIKSRDYNAAVNAFNTGARLADSNNTTTINQPVAPTYENCQTVEQDGVPVYDYACQQRNSAKQADYQHLMSAYSTAKALEQAEAQKKTAQQEELARQAELDSAKALAESAQKKNEKSSQIYQLASQLSAAYSAYQAAMYAASCGTAGCTCTSCLMQSIAFAIFSGMASKQASSNDGVAHNACVAASKLSSNGGGCGAPPTQQNPNEALSSLFSSSGACIGDPSKCNEIVSNLPPGTNIKEVMRGLNSIASSKPPFKINPDGTVTTRDGKTLPASSFTTEAGLIAAGMPAGEAKAFMAKLKAQGLDPDSRAQAAALARLNELKKNSGGELPTSGAPKTLEVTLNGNSGKEKDIGGGKREIASAEGLARDFNGEQIGVAGDDIFKMMNRRYKLKASQDAFMAP